MKPLDIIIVIALAAAFIIALIHTVKNSKKSCGGDCAQCGKACGRK